MKRFKHGLGNKIAIAVAVIVLTVAIISGTSYASNGQLLGDCKDYGIVCNELKLTADVETNFATGTFYYEGHTFGNTVDLSLIHI